MWQICSQALELSKYFFLLFDLRQYRVQGVPHFVADGWVHDGQVLLLNLQGLALHPEGDVLELEHHLLIGPLPDSALIKPNDFYREESRLRNFWAVFNDPLHLVHLLTLCEFFGSSENAKLKYLIINFEDVCHGEHFAFFDNSSLEIIAISVAEQVDEWFFQWFIIITYQIFCVVIHKF